MRYMDRILIGVLLVIVSVVCLYMGSPQRTGDFNPNPALAYGFTLFFALGFIFMAMGLLGMEDDYPAFLSGFVLFFIVGGLIAVLLYVNGEGQWLLEDADDPRFWQYWAKMAALWPLKLVEMAGFLGYHT